MFGIDQSLLSLSTPSHKQTYLSWRWTRVRGLILLAVNLGGIDMCLCVWVCGAHTECGPPPLESHTCWPPLALIWAEWGRGSTYKKETELPVLGL